MKARQWKVAERSPSQSSRLKAWSLGHLPWLFGALLLSTVLFFFVREVMRPAVVIEVVAVPKAMKDAGLDTDIVARHVIDRISDIENENFDLGILTKPKSFRDVKEQELPAYDIPGFHISTRDVIKLLRHLLSKEPTTVDISVSQNEDQSFALQVRIQPSGGQAETLLPDTPMTGHAQVMEGAARLILRQFDPSQLANMLYTTQGKDHFKVLEYCVDRLERDKKVQCLVTWGDMEADGLHDTRAQARYQQALQWKADAAEALSGLGAIELLRGNPELAQDLFERARRAGLATQMVHFNLAQLQFWRGEFGGAVWQLQQAERGGKPNPGLLMWQAYLQRLNKQEDAAAATYLRALEASPQRASTVSSWAAMLAQAGRVEEAMANIQMAQRLMTTPQVSVNIDIGSVMLEKKNFSEALQAFEYAAQQLPESSSALLQLALAEAGSGKQGLASAVHRLEHAVDFDPDDWRAYAWLGYLLDQQEQPVAAIAALKRSIALNPNGAEAYRVWGEVLGHNKEDDAAAQKLLDALKRTPCNGYLHQLLAGALERLKRGDEAEAEMVKAYQYSARSVELLMEWGRMLDSHEKHAVADEKWREAIQLSPRAARIYQEYGAALWNQQRYGEALLLYRRAIAQVPDDLDLRLGLFYTWVMLDQDGEADAVLTAAERLDPAEQKLPLQRGILLDRQERFHDAEIKFRLAVKRDPNSVDAYTYLVRALGEQGEWVAARMELDQALLLNPDFPAARDLRQEVLDRMQRAGQAIVRK
jgi:Flp pilus assembly protein TadD